MMNSSKHALHYLKELTFIARMELANHGNPMLHDIIEKQIFTNCMHHLVRINKIDFFRYLVLKGIFSVSFY